MQLKLSFEDEAINKMKIDSFNKKIIENVISEADINKIKMLEQKNYNKFKYGQYFTKTDVVERVLDILEKYKNYDKSISILEPSFGTGNFINVLKKRGFSNIIGCEIDPALTDNPSNFFNLALENKFKLIVGNPPFTKYNISESYYYATEYEDAKINSGLYIPKKMIKKDKYKMENVFILKAISHLMDADSTIAFVLPISFFIKNRNSDIKEIIKDRFSTIIIFQDDKIWFDYDIPCCFAIFTNNVQFQDKILIHYENDKENIKALSFDMLNEEIIPKVIFNKESQLMICNKGNVLSKYIINMKVNYKRSFEDNNVSAKNILQKTEIPDGEDVSDYKLAVVRVGNSSVGKCGLINVKKDILNDMFYVFDFNKEAQYNKELKQSICKEINKNQMHFKQITCRVGSKSIKREDVFNFHLKEDF